MKTLGVFPGTFDPITLGHLDLIQRALRICDKLLVAIPQTSTKETLFSLEERMEMARIATQELLSIEVISFTGLTIDLAKQRKASFLVRGLRSHEDFDYEWDLALINHKLGNIETIFLMAGEKYSMIHSKDIRKILSQGGEVQELVPSSIADKVKKTFS